jgi:superfamily I DNA/RNA helicase
MKENSHEKTNVMFETIDETKKIEKVFHDDPKRAENKKKELRRSKKANFWMNRGPNRLSTVFSFKGWESPVLFLVIEARDRSDFRRLNNGYQPERFSDELVYTGLTRCKGKLYIINIEDDRDYTHHYDSFFNSLPDTLVTKAHLVTN